jgi:hypothetical protein
MLDPLEDDRHAVTIGNSFKKNTSTNGLKNSCLLSKDCVLT